MLGGASIAGRVRLGGGGIMCVSGWVTRKKKMPLCAQCDPGLPGSDLLSITLRDPAHTTPSGGLAPLLSLARVFRVTPFLLMCQSSAPEDVRVPGGGGLGSVHFRGRITQGWRMTRRREGGVGRGDANVKPPRSSFHGGYSRHESAKIPGFGKIHTKEMFPPSVPFVAGSGVTPPCLLQARPTRPLRP